MDVSIFEVIMLVCFGAAWPFSILKSYYARSNAGKSIIFLCIVFTGYVAGVIHKLLYDHDVVILLYMLNGIMVSIDMLLYQRNRLLTAK